MDDSTRITRFRFWLWLIRVIGVIVPRRLRADWRQEWEAELQYREALLAEWERLDRRNKFDLLWRSASAFWDALALQPKRLEDEMFQDLRFGARMLLKSKGFTLVAVLSLALGIGANTALFSVMDAVMLKTLPVRDPEQLVVFRWLGSAGWYKGFMGSNDKDAATGLDVTSSMSAAAFERFRDQNQTMTSVFAFASLGLLNLNIDGQAEMASGQVVSGNYFAGLGVTAALGRALTNEDDKTSAAPAAVINYRYWQRRFGGDPAVVGKVIYIGGAAFTVVGVMPPGFFGTLEVGSAPDITVPLGTLAQVSRRYAEFQRSASNWWLQIMGRLKPGVSAKQAQAELTALAQRHALELPKDADEERVAPQIRLDSGSQGLMRQRRRFSSQFDVLTALAALALLIACVNLANLSLARAATRQKEMAVRLSVGASRLRLVRQLLTESMLLAALGAALGLLFAYWGKDALLALLVGGSGEFAVDLRLDWRALGFAAAISALTGLLFGLAPALRATRVELTPMLKETPGAGAAPRSRLSKALIVAQVAMSLALLTGAGLFARTLRNLNQIDAGFDRENLLIFSVNPRYESSRRASLYQQLTERIAALPGVSAVSSSRYPLLAFRYTGEELTVPGYTPRAGEDMNVRTAEVAPNFLATMGIPLLLGREFTPQDKEQAPNVAVVSQALAARFFPIQNPLGQRLIVDGTEMQIIGVARDAKYGGIRESIMPVVYLPYLQNRPAALAEMSFAVRTVGDPAASIAAIRQAVQSIDRNLPLFGVRTQSELIARSFAQERLFATLSSFFGLLALALVSIGLYGVMSYTVARRTHELGIRMALGATGGVVLRMVLGEALWLVLTGLALGLVTALMATRWLTKLLYGVTPADPLTLGLATLLLLAVAMLAGYLPARRAARVDPLVALRHD
jgi:predicted permease